MSTTSDKSNQQSPKRTSTEVSTPDMTVEEFTLWERIESYIARLSTKNNFWHRVCSLIWLPFAFRSGITMRQVTRDSFTAVLPFKRSNRNFYNAMAGAALLGNSEVAAGIFLFKHCGGDHAVVCKNMSYRFLRPCYGPAIYSVKDAQAVTEELTQQMQTHDEFNISLVMDITQVLRLNSREREVRVGRCEITFHCTPKQLVKARAKRRKARSTK